MNIIFTTFLSLLSLVVLFLLTKLMGYRQVSQMSTFDYINGITIGSIAAELAISSKEEYLIPLIATIIYAIAVTIVSNISDKSIHLRRFIVGKPLILLNDGQISKRNLKKARIDLNEFLTQCRVSGYFDLSQIQTVILEPNGRFSILAKSEYRPVIPADLNLSLEQNYLDSVVIIDGKVMTKNLSQMGKESTWLSKELKKHGIFEISDCFLATLSTTGKLTAYSKVNAILEHTPLI